MASPHVPIPLRIAALLAVSGAVAAHAQSGSDFSRLGNDGGFSDARPYRPTLVPIFFPPNPPPLGRALPPSSTSASRFAAPPELAAYVNEIFYPPLGTQLYLETLNAKLRAELAQYRATKVALQSELRAELGRVRDLEPAARISALAALSRRQTPKIIELEKNAEQLRRGLITSDTTWSAAREWHLGDNPKRGFSPFEIAEVMRGYAFYQNGLLPAQRRLLREISLELMMAADSTDKAAAAQPHMFFPPEPARVLIPEDAPAAVAAKVAAYQTKKSQLKKELYDAVWRHDGARFGFLDSTLRTLVDKQTPRLAELERLAEEIRVGLAEVPEPERVTERSPLPPTLHARVAQLTQDFAAAQKEAAGKLQTTLLHAPEVRATYRFENEGLKYVVIPSRGPSRGGAASTAGASSDADKVAAVRAEFAAVAEDYGRRLAELINEKDAIVLEASRALGTTKPEAINNALTAAIRVANAKETESSYRDYRVAVFQRGLSPEQRRLLFDWVVEQLALPLPRGELQPMQRGNSW